MSIYRNDCNNFNNVTINQTSFTEATIFNDLSNYWRLVTYPERPNLYTGIEFNIGTFPDVYEIQIALENLSVGTFSAGHYFRIVSNKSISNNTHTLDIYFATDGLFINDGGVFREIGNNIVVQAIFTNWSFYVNTLTKTVQVYKNGIYQGVSNCNTLISMPHQITLKQYSTVSSGSYYYAYIDWIEFDTLHVIQATIYKAGVAAANKNVIITNDSNGAIIFQGVTDANGKITPVLVDNNTDEHTVIAIDPSGDPPVCAHRVKGT